VLDGRDQLEQHLRQSYEKGEAAAEMAAAFDHSATVREYETTEDVQLLRLYSRDSHPGGSTQKGRWFFCCLDHADADGTALPIANDMDRLAMVTVPAGTRMLVGVVANQTSPGMRPKGGNTQFLFPNGPPESARYVDYERVKARTPRDPADLKVVLDDGSKARFRPAPER
jgi:hypothetical protein